MVTENKHLFFSSISFFQISYKTIWLKTWSWYKTHWKMKSGRVLIGIYQKIRIKNLNGGSVRSDLKKLDSFTLEASKNHLFRNFLRNGRVRVMGYYLFRKKTFMNQVDRFDLKINFARQKISVKLIGLPFRSSWIKTEKVTFTGYFKACLLPNNWLLMCN